MDSILTGKKRVVITGIGTVNSLGLNTTDFWNNMLEGKSGISLVEGFDTHKINSRIAGQIKNFDPHDFINVKEAKRMDRFAQFGVAAALMAIEDSKLKINENNCNDIGVYIGSGVGGIGTIEEQNQRLLEKGADRVSPFLVPMMICNMAAAQVSILTGAKGPVSATTTACAAGSNA
ncbi:MAG: beta-ketoacyl synthase N-terminal-like domain-containing protein, partial [Actinobacteria bacterium]|nr:beta-ketoacyl synthase N-terminal-like domain-containing protein [Actinomycetota bacterium]